MLDRLGHGFVEIEFWYAVSRWTSREQERFANEYQKICAAKTRLNLDILRRFDAAGIRLALPMELRWNVEGDPNGPGGPRSSRPAALVERQGLSAP